MPAAEKPPEKNGPSRRIHAIDVTSGEQYHDVIRDYRRLQHQATIPAFILPALGPLMTRASARASFIRRTGRPINPMTFGTFIEPMGGERGDFLEYGVRVLCTDGYSLIMIRADKAQARGPLRVHFPPAMVEAATAKRIQMINQNEQPFEELMEPVPSVVICTEEYGTVGIERLEGWQERRFQGTLGVWNNQDYPGVKACEGYRCESADLEILNSIRATLRAGMEAKPHPLDRQIFDLAHLGPIAHAAQFFSTPMEVSAILLGQYSALRMKTPDEAIVALFMSSTLDQGIERD